MPPFVAAALTRKKIPLWVLPVIAALPVWAYSFAGTMQQPETEDELLIEAAELYTACSGCHGGNGGGGVGYALSGGEVLATFPDPIDQMAHVARGSDAILGEGYGAERADGQRVSGGRGRGPMPAQLEFQLRDDGKIAIQDLDLTLAGGRLNTRGLLHTEKGLSADASVGVQSVDLKELLQLIGVEGLEGTGKLSGSIPIRIAGGNLVIRDGNLRALGPGRLRYGGSALEKFFSTHPDPGARASSVRAQVQALPPKSLRKDSPSFHTIKDRVKAMPRPPSSGQ